MQLYDNVCFVVCGWCFLFMCCVGVGGSGVMMAFICLTNECGLVLLV